jgi:hypothetical protein
MKDDITLGEPVREHSTLVRPHFSAGLLLQDDDLTQGVTYTRALSRMMFRTLFGCGVLCGLTVAKPESDKCGGWTIGIEKGLALDCLGDPVEVPCDDTLTISCAKDVDNELWIGLRKTEKCCAPRTAVCSPDDGDPPSVCTRERDGFELQVFSEKPPCACGCKPLPPVKKEEPKKKKGEATGIAASSTEVAAAVGDKPDCRCNQRYHKEDCYEKHYLGECPCDCCDCEWIILAMAKRDDPKKDWVVDHSVRRFVRPVLMLDPVVEKERNPAPDR